MSDQDEPEAEIEFAMADDDIIACWCGDKGTYDELFQDVIGSCGGTGYVDCYCGGDLCVCHRHGQEFECPGCDECDDLDDQDDRDDGWDDGRDDFYDPEGEL